MRGTREGGLGCCMSGSGVCSFVSFQAGGIPHTMRASCTNGELAGRFGVWTSDDDDHGVHECKDLDESRIMTLFHICLLCFNSPSRFANSQQHACFGCDMSNLRREHQK